MMLTNAKYENKTMRIKPTTVNVKLTNLQPVKQFLNDVARAMKAKDDKAGMRIVRRAVGKISKHLDKGPTNGQTH